MLVTYKYKLKPSRQQYIELDHLLQEQRVLYNAALQERIDCYRHTGRSRSFFDQCKALTEWRQSDPAAASLPVTMQRWTLKRLDDAYQAFFRRLRQGKAGFPRFRSSNFWKSFGFGEFSGIQLVNNKLSIKGLSSKIRIHWHRALPELARIASVVFTRSIGRWYVAFQIELPDSTDVALRKPAVGIDVGIEHLAVLSDGTVISNPRVTRRHAQKLRQKQRALARCNRRSNRRKKVRAEVTRCYAKIVNTRATYLHQVSAKLVRNYSHLVFEKLKIKNLIKSPLAKSIHDVAWAKLRAFTNYKAARAGVRISEVDPRYTSQICSGCGAIRKKTLQERIHHCVECGLILGRDLNAACNILARAVVGPRIGNAVHVWNIR